jgi:hypothetical protein
MVRGRAEIDDASGARVHTYLPLMRYLRHSCVFGPWPFWLLLLAWLCANVPGRVSSHVLTWMIHAGSISHQEQLGAGLTRMAQGEIPSADVAAAEDPDDSRVPFEPALPSEATVKNIDLSAEVAEDFLVSSASRQPDWMSRKDMQGLLRDRPPHGPPRGRLHG